MTRKRQARRLTLAAGSGLLISIVISRNPPTRSAISIAIARITMSISTGAGG